MTTIGFDMDSVGALPADWTAGVTGRGNPRWIVEQDPGAPSAPNVLKQLGSGDFPWCVTENGSRKTIKYEKAPVAGNTWHFLRAEFRDRRIRVLLDGKAYIELDDARISGPGAVGVWTKADSVTAFDDFSFGP